MNVFRCLAALMFVEDMQQLAEHFAGRVLADLLCDRYQLDPGLPEFPDVEFGVQRIPAEPAQRMHHHEIEGLIRPLGGMDHFLENRAVLIERGRSRLGEDLNDLDALPLTPYAALGDLIGDRQVSLGLPGCRHADIDRRAGHGRLLLVEEDRVDLPAKIGAQDRHFVAQHRHRRRKVTDHSLLAAGLPDRRWRHSPLAPDDDPATALRRKAALRYGAGGGLGVHLPLSTGNALMQPRPNFSSGIRLVPLAREA
nr:hypothetical protein [Sphingopyxis sp. GW247-27LB]